MKTRKLTENDKVRLDEGLSVSYSPGFGRGVDRCAEERKGRKKVAWRLWAEVALATERAEEMLRELDVERDSAEEVHTVASAIISRFSRALEQSERGLLRRVEEVLEARGVEYGSSCLEPGRIWGRPPVERLMARIEDKLARLHGILGRLRDGAFGDMPPRPCEVDSLVDTVIDLVGYLFRMEVLFRQQQRKGENNEPENAPIHDDKAE